MQRWENKILDVPMVQLGVDTRARLEDHLNRLGQEGWEVVAVRDGYARQVFLKRPMADEK